ncbi:unnamed protein product [Amoebophrya sp. A25]|nr:unnamed protein product [Amoebophrya sp. A25]|eukprot:GSA25T00010969001.1
MSIKPNTVFLPLTQSLLWKNAQESPVYLNTKTRETQYHLISDSRFEEYAAADHRDKRTGTGAEQRVSKSTMSQPHSAASSCSGTSSSLRTQGILITNYLRQEHLVGGRESNKCTDVEPAQYKPLVSSSGMGRKNLENHHEATRTMLTGPRSYVTATASSSSQPLPKRQMPLLMEERDFDLRHSSARMSGSCFNKKKNVQSTTRGAEDLHGPEDAAYQQAVAYRNGRLLPEPESRTSRNCEEARSDGRNTDSRFIRRDPATATESSGVGTPNRRTSSPQNAKPCSSSSTSLSTPLNSGTTSRASRTLRNCEKTVVSPSSAGEHPKASRTTRRELHQQQHDQGKEGHGSSSTCEIYHTVQKELRRTLLGCVDD